jgi:hypothetical protein
MKWNTCEECMPIVDKLFALWVRGGNAGGMEAVRIQMEREHLARWLSEHRRRFHARIDVKASGDAKIAESA